MSGTPSSPPPDVTTSVRPAHPDLSRKGNMTRDTNVPNTYWSPIWGKLAELYTIASAVDQGSFKKAMTEKELTVGCC